MGYKDNHFEHMNLSAKSLTMERELKALADEYGYSKLPMELANKQRAHYMEELDPFWRNEIFKTTNFLLLTPSNKVLATGVSERGFVCGDYGVFLEIDDDFLNHSEIMIQPGQEYRMQPRFSSCKYLWYTDKGGDGIKLYYQRGCVSYADYEPGYWYISPYEVSLQII